MEDSPARRWNVIGVMSGSSLDGLDVALCWFEGRDEGWCHGLGSANTFPFPAPLRSALQGAMSGSALDLARVHRDLGTFIGQCCAEMAAGRQVDLVASHGHTIFHRPEERLTMQVGCGARIAALAGTPVVCDFRTTDVARGGQGAPLVPLGERLLFPSHRTFLNIGGICNIALHGSDRVTGYDVCIGNQALNFLAGMAGQRHDTGGAMASSGTVHYPLLAHLDALPFHHLPPPRSLGREWFEESMRPLLADTAIPLADRLRTVVEHIAGRLTHSLRGAEGRLLVSGGGAHNDFLMERVRALVPLEVDIPEPAVVDFKEALTFALLGLLRWLGKPNALASVTGATLDSSGGAVYLPN